MPRTRYYRRPISYRRYRRYRRSYGRLSRRTRYSRRIVSSRSRLSVRVPYSSNLTLTWGAGETTTGVVCVNPFSQQPISGNKVCVSSVMSPCFDAYANLFDEVKCDGLKAQFSITTPLGIGATLPSANIISVVDRRASYYETQPSQAGGYPTPANMVAYSSVSNREVMNNNVAKMSRSIWASDLIEKCQFIDSGVTVQANSKNVTAYGTASWNPTFFCPGIYFVVTDLPAPGQGQTGTLNARIQMYAYYTFRNPKYAPSASSRNVEERAAAFEMAVQRVAQDHPGVVIDPDLADVDELLEAAETSGQVVKNKVSDAQPSSSTKMEE